MGVIQPIKTVTQKASNVWKGGGSAGLISGLTTGVPLMVGVHPFISYVLGGVLGGAFIKNPEDKRGVIRESVREAIIQLFSAD